MRVRYYCHYGALTGYGRAARDYLAALHAAGVELEIAVLGQKLDSADQQHVASPEPRYRHLDELTCFWDEATAPCDVEVYHAQPRLLAALAPQIAKRDDRKYVALTTWETSRVPWEYLRGLSHFNAIIVPSEFCADVFDGTLRDDPVIWDGDPPPGAPSVPDVHIVPHCFDPRFWVVPPAPRRDDGIVRFYSIGAWGERKNMLGLLRAYLSEFSKADAVSLHLRIDGCDFGEVRSLLARSGLGAVDDRNPNLPAISIPDSHPLTEAELVSLHAENDCFVSATRCEGWGLGLFEAAIMGRHVISPLWGGQSDFLDHYGLCEGVPHILTPCFGSEERRAIEGQYVKSVVSIPPGVTCRQKWAEPDLCALAARMRYVYEMRRGERAVPFLSPNEVGNERSELERKFSYGVVGPMFANTLREIA